MQRSELVALLNSMPDVEVRVFGAKITAVVLEKAVVGHGEDDQAEYIDIEYKHGE